MEQTEAKRLCERESEREMDRTLSYVCCCTWKFRISSSEFNKFFLEILVFFKIRQQTTPPQNLCWNVTKSQSFFNNTKCYSVWKILLFIWAPYNFFILYGMYVCIYICMRFCVWVCLSVFCVRCVCVYVCVFVCEVCVCLCVCVHFCVYVCIDVSAYVGLCDYILFFIPR